MFFFLLRALFSIRKSLDLVIRPLHVNHTVVTGNTMGRLINLFVPSNLSNQSIRHLRTSPEDHRMCLLPGPSREPLLNQTWMSISLIGSIYRTLSKKIMVSCRQQPAHVFLTNLLSSKMINCQIVASKSWPVPAFLSNAQYLA